MPPSNMRVQRARSAASPSCSPLTRRPLGSGDNVTLCGRLVEFSRPSETRAFSSSRTRHSQTWSASSRVNLFVPHGGAILRLTSSSPSCRSSLITRMCSSRSCSTVRTRSSTGPYGPRHSLWVARASSGRCRGSRSTPSVFSNVLPEEVSQSVPSGRPSRNSKGVSSSRRRRSTRSWVVTKWRWSPGGHGRGEWVARPFILFRVPERPLRTRLSDLALPSRHSHGRPGAPPPNTRVQGARRPRYRSGLSVGIIAFRALGFYVRRFRMAIGQWRTAPEHAGQHSETR